MAKRKSTNKYYFSVEGETEQSGFIGVRFLEVYNGARK